jgi:hypothetical protein
MDVVPATVRLAILAAVLVTAACSNPGGPAGPPVPLSNTFESPEALARGVLAALQANDADRLRALQLSEAEFKAHVWPELPVSRPERNVPFDYAWGQMQQRSDGSLQTTLSRYAGRSLVFRSTRFTGDLTQYASFDVMRQSEITAADETGRELVLKLYGSAMRKDGRYKLYSFVVDD